MIKVSTPSSPPQGGLSVDASETVTSPGEEKPRIYFKFSAFSGFFHWTTPVIGIVGIVVGLVMPPDGIGGTVCASYRVLGYPCPGCGLTRSVSSILHGNFEQAWGYHPMGYGVAFIFILMVLTALVPKSVAQHWRTHPPVGDKVVGLVGGGAIISLLIFGLIRMFYMYAKFPPNTPWW